MTTMVVFLCLMLPALAEITITPPTEIIQVGQRYLLSVEGLTAADLPRTVVVVEPKETTSAVGVTGWGGEQYLWFHAVDEGRRFIAVIIGGMGKPVVSTLVLDVGRVPQPDPPPPPPPPGELTVVVVYESTDRTPQEALVLLGLRKYLVDQSLAYRLVDKDLKDSTGQAPTWFEVPRSSALKKGLPCLVIGTVQDGLFSVVVAERLPNSIKDAIDIVERYRTAEDSSSLYVPTPLDIVVRMLKEARVTADDILFDLGSGDGRILITAAKQYGCRTVGYEIEPNLVVQSQANAKAAGVENLVTIHHQKIEEADLGSASVVCLYLDESLLGNLAPKLQRLQVGARIVSHDHPIPGMPAERIIVVESGGRSHSLYVYQIPISTVRTPGPHYRGPHPGCMMCLGNHLQSTHRVSRPRLDTVGYQKWGTLHDNHHNHKVLACTQ